MEWKKKPESSIQLERSLLKTCFFKDVAKKQTPRRIKKQQQKKSTSACA